MTAPWLPLVPGQQVCDLDEPVLEKAKRAFEQVRVKVGASMCADAKFVIAWTSPCRNLLMNEYKCTSASW